MLRHLGTRVLYYRLSSERAGGSPTALKEGEILSWEDAGEGRQQRGAEPSFKVTFMGTKSQEVEGGAGEPAGPEGHRW